MGKTSSILLGSSLFWAQFQALLAISIMTCDAVSLSFVSEEVGDSPYIIALIVLPTLEM